MNMPAREVMVEEAVKRMKVLKMLKQPIKECLEGLLNLSEWIGILYWLDDEQQKIVEDFEKENEAVVYHVIHSMTSIGEMYALLYVSKHEEEWENDMEDLKNGEALAYVFNKSMPDCSEFGYIGVVPMNGGVKRIW